MTCENGGRGLRAYALVQLAHICAKSRQCQGVKDIIGDRSVVKLFSEGPLFL